MSYYDEGNYRKGTLLFLAVVFFIILVGLIC